MLDKLCRNPSHLENLLKQKLNLEEDLKILKWLHQDNQDVVEEWHKTVAWMRQVTNQTGYQCDMFALAVHILDSFLGLMKIHGKYLKCAALTSCYIASKIMEEKDNVHSLVNLLAINRSKFTSSDIVRMEKIILQKIGWDLNSTPTAATFLEIYFNLLCANHFETVFGSDSLAYSIYRSLASRLEMCYCEPSLQAFPGSTKALSLLSCTMEKITSRWFLYIDPLAKLSEISIEDILECRELIKLHIFGITKPQKPKLHRPRKKFSRRSSWIQRQSRTLLSPIVENPFETELTRQHSRSRSLNRDDNSSDHREDISDVALTLDESRSSDELKRFRSMKLFDGEIPQDHHMRTASPAKRRKLVSNCAVQSSQTESKMLISPVAPPIRT